MTFFRVKRFDYFLYRKSQTEAQPMNLFIQKRKHDIRLLQEFQDICAPEKQTLAQTGPE